MSVSIQSLKGETITTANGKKTTFTGLKLVYDKGQDKYIRWPFTVTQQGTSVVIRWDQDETVEIKLADTAYSTMGQLMASLRSILDGDNGLISEWPKGDVSIDGGANALTLTTTGDVAIDATNIVAPSMPNYADDTAADADGGLPSGGLYTTTAGGRTLFIKP